MAYIGTKPTIGNFQICDAISVVNGQAAYTMQVGSVNVSPQSANHMIVSLNGTIQKPNSSFTVSGSTITFASNLATGDVIDFIQILGDVLDLGVPSDSTVSLAKLTATGTKDATTFLRGDNTFNAPPNTGITNAQIFRITADLTGTDNNQAITTNIEEVDSDSYSSIGNIVSQSSGVFSFSSTGLYQVQFNANYTGGGTNDFVAMYIQTTINNSTYTDKAEGTLYNTYESSMTTSTFVNVDNTTNVKVKFRVQGMKTTSIFKGDTDINETFFTFTRLGDNQ